MSKERANTNEIHCTENMIFAAKTTKKRPVIKEETRKKLLSLVAETPDIDMAAAQQKMDVSLTSISVTLNDLAKEGFLTSKKVGARKLWRITKEGLKELTCADSLPMSDFVSPEKTENKDGSGSISVSVTDPQMVAPESAILSRKEIEKESIRPLSQPMSLEVLYSWVFLERNSNFNLKTVRRVGEEKVMQYVFLQRAVGMGEGIVKEFNATTKLGKIEVDGQEIIFQANEKPYDDYRPLSWSDLIGKKIRYHFWPTLDEPSQKLSPLKIFNMKEMNHRFIPGYVEAIGKLEKIWPDRFVVALWSKKLNRWFYVPFWGEYPYPDEQGKYVWIVGKFNFSTNRIHFEEGTVLAFVPKEKAPKKNFQKKYGSQVSQKRPAGPGKEKNDRRAKGPILEISLESIDVPEILRKTLEKKTYNKEFFSKLKDDYKKLGKSPAPIVLKKTAKRYLLIKGIHRLTIAKDLGFNTIHAYVQK